MTSEEVNHFSIWTNLVLEEQFALLLCSNYSTAHFLDASNRSGKHLGREVVLFLGAPRFAERCQREIRNVLQVELIREF